jgi:hypothetical protein
MQFDFAQHVISTNLRPRNHELDLRDLSKILAQRLGHNRVVRQTGGLEYLVDPADGARFPRGPLVHEVEPPLEGKWLQHRPQAFVCRCSQKIRLQPLQAQDLPFVIGNVTDPEST